MKKLLASLLCTLMLGVSFQPVLANDDTYESGYNPTKEELVSKEQKNQEALVYQINKSKNRYIVQKNILNFNSSFTKQSNSYDCGPASGLMIAKYAGASATITSMRSKMGTKTTGSNKGTTVEGALNGLNYYVGGYDSYSLYDGHSVTALTEISIDDDMPVMYNVKYMDLPWISSSDSSINHWIVGYGYHWDPNNNLSNIYCADPSWSSFRTKTIEYSDLEYAMERVVDSTYNSYGFFLAEK